MGSNAEMLQIIEGTPRGCRQGLTTFMSGPLPHCIWVPTRFTTSEMDTHWALAWFHWGHNQVTVMLRREQHIEAGHAVRVAAIQSKRSQSQQFRFSRLHRQRVGASRRLSSLRRVFRSKPPAGEPPLAPTVDAYAEYTSNVYAPLQRLGRFPETCRRVLCLLSPRPT